ncbi:MAG: NTP transferase domain-containing protein [Ruegeria sp.]|uniref:nucleotidyltransferase family protein n=1 Tax=Ruegeria sp. TaxID=1879320 RepID=UPI00349EB76E
MSEIPIILLAAGQSSRMGGTDKLMQQVDGIPLLRRAAGIARQVGPVFVALPPQPHPRYSALSGLDVGIVEVPDAAEGMNASLRRAIAALPEQTPAAMILLADLPDLTVEDLQTTLYAVSKFPACKIWRGATEDGKPGHPVIFHRSLFPELIALTGDNGAHSVTRRHPENVHLVPLPGQRARLDLDTPADWQDWRNRKRDRE